MKPFFRNISLQENSYNTGIGTKPPALTGREKFLLLALMLLVLLPRFLLSFRLVSICNDGFYYIGVSRSLEEGRYESAFAYLNLNIYPLILLCVRQLGFEWVRGAQLWGLFVSACTLFPLFGWVRRLFDNRTAMASCFLFAIHPGLIELSIEPIREPTFWFLVMVCLYLILKSTEVRRFWFYLLTGIVLTMAIHTRTEGWFLIVPLLVWPTLVWWRDRRHFFEHALGTTLMLSVLPLILTLINLTVLSGYREWEWGRLSHFQTAYEWVNGKISKANVENTENRNKEAREKADDILQNQKDEDARKRLLMKQQASRRAQKIVLKNKQKNIAKTDPQFAEKSKRNIPQNLTREAAAESSIEPKLWEFLQQLVTKIKPFNLLFFAIGVFAAGKSLLRFDKLVLVFLFLGLIGAVWIRLSQIGDMNGRYFFTPFLFVIPIAALGLQSCVLSFRTKLLPGFFTLLKIEKLFSPNFVTWLLLALLAAGHFVDALGDVHRHRGDQRKLGEWLLKRHGPFDSVLVDRGATRVGFFIEDKVPDSTEFFVEPGEHEEWRHPQILVLTKEMKPSDETAYMKEQLVEMKMRKLTDLPKELTADFDVYLRVEQPNRRKQIAKKNSRSGTLRK